MTTPPRHDFYQTPQSLTLTIYKSLTNLKTNITQDALQVSSDEYSHVFNFPHQVTPESSTVNQNKMNVQIVLAKKSADTWASVERKGDSSQNQPTGYPSSARNKTDFAKIDREFVEDKPEGEAAVNELFKSIYANGPEDTKRAMMKSWTESGGTCLSTNWDEVGKGKVEVKPPQGMEARDWAK